MADRVKPLERLEWKLEVRGTLRSYLFSVAEAEYFDYLLNRVSRLSIPKSLPVYVKSALVVW